MLVIPTEKMDEWNSEYDRLPLNQQISRVSFLAHCAATWGFDQALKIMYQFDEANQELE